MSRPRKAAPPPLPSDVERLLSWNRARPVPERFLEHDDPAVRALAEATRVVVHAFWARNGDHGSPLPWPVVEERELALDAAVERLAAERRHFADRRGLPWKHPRPPTYNPKGNA